MSLKEIDRLTTAVERLRLELEKASPDWHLVRELAFEVETLAHHLGRAAYCQAVGIGGNTAQEGGLR